MTDTLFDKPTKRGLAIRQVIDFLEYLLLLVVLLECNSMYINVTETVSHVDMYLLFYRLALLLVAVSIALHIWLNPRSLKTLAPYGLVLAGLMAWIIGFYLLNPRQQSGWRCENYELNFMLLLPMLTALFKLKQREGKGFDLLFKYSDIVCVLGFMSLVIYLASVIRADSVPADVIYTRWNNRGVTMAQINLLDVCQSVPRTRWQMFGISLLRNRGPFVEPLMFALPLLVSLYTELFLRDRPSCWRRFRLALLTVTLLVVNTTIGLMLMAGAWGLKGMQLCFRHGKRWLVIPILVAALCACGLLFIEKNHATYEDTEVSSSSLNTHFEDYKVTLTGFSKNPLVGGGYQNENYIRLFMREYRLEQNPGLSNSAGVILAEGGLMLGLLCMLPFAIWMLYFFRKRDDRVALWGIGPIGLYIGIIFKYHMLMMLLIAFGYSLLDVRRADRGFPFRLTLADTTGWGAEAYASGKESRNRRTAPVGAIVLTLAAIALAWFGAPAWHMLHDLLVSLQFSVGQSPLRSFCLAFVLLLHGVSVRNARRGELSPGRIALLAICDALYLLLYPTLFSAESTALSLLGQWGELRECVLLMAAWLIPALLILRLNPRNWINRKGAILAGIVLVAICGAIIAANAVVGRAVADDALLGALENLSASGSGRVYVNDLPLLYARKVKGVVLTTTRDRGFEVKDNASVVFTGEAEHRELLEQGFQVARLTEDHLVYSNDQAAIDTLTAQGVQFYRYYPYGHAVNLEDMADLNGLSLTEDGAVVVDGPIESLVSGPYVTLLNGKYKAVYELHIDPQLCDRYSGDTRVCRASVTLDYGTKEIAESSVPLSAFDEAGNAAVEVPFTLKEPKDAVEYHLFGEGDFRIDVASVSIVQAPDYITLVRYNSHRDAIREEYFNTDGTPMLRDGTYAALERSFNMANRVKSVRYYDANGNPAVVGSGFVEVRYDCNALGSRTSEEYIGADGKPVLIALGYASVKTEYDGYGNPILVRYFDEEGQLTIISNGYAMIRKTYDNRRQIIREDYLDTEGNPIALPTGQAALERDYDQAGNVIEYRYYDTQNQLAEINAGYAIMRRGYDAGNRVTEESFFDRYGQPAILGRIGYSRIGHQYDDGNLLYASYYYDKEGNRLEAGSGRFHDYLQSLFDKDYTVFISIKDEGTKSLTAALLQDLKQLGLETDLQGKIRNSFIAVISPEGVYEAISDCKPVSYEGNAAGAHFSIASAGYEMGGYSSIMINGAERSKNVRGMNIVVLDNTTGQVVDCVTFDTYDPLMTVTR